MNPYLKLKKIFAEKRRTFIGEVVGVTDTVVSVRSSSGVIDARKIDSVAYMAGDHVLVCDGLVRGKVKSASTIPVYYV
jgi:hypothetical protein